MGRITQLLPVPGEPERLFVFNRSARRFRIGLKAPIVGASAAHPAKF